MLGCDRLQCSHLPPNCVLVLYPMPRWVLCSAVDWCANDFVPALIQMNLQLDRDMAVCRANPAVADLVRQLNTFLFLPLQSLLHRLKKGWQLIVEE